MSEGLKRTGSCLCGGVTYELTLQETDVHVCHCGLCNKWGGGPAIALSCEKDWKITGEENLTWFQSNEWAQRGFCNKCGTHLFGRAPEGDYCGVYAGSVDNKDGFAIGEHIFIDNKPLYYDFKDDAQRLTEAEFFAQFSNDEEAV